MTKPKLPTMNIQSSNSVISDEMLQYYFDGTNFGCEQTATNQRRLLANGLLKHQAGWHNGYTMQQLIKAHDIVNKKGNINKRGRMFLWEYFRNDNV